MSLAWFSRALQRLKLHGEFPPAEQEMLFRALHADTTTEMFFSQIVAVEELVAWLEACPRKGDAGYVPADYVDPPELQEVTAEAPRVDAARISRVSKPVGEGSFGSTVVSVAHWKQSWKKKKQKVALKRAIDPKEKVVELEASLQDLDEVVRLEPRNDDAVAKRNAVAEALEKAKALVREAAQAPAKAAVAGTCVKSNSGALRRRRRRPRRRSPHSRVDVRAGHHGAVCPPGESESLYAKVLRRHVSRWRTERDHGSGPVPADGGDAKGPREGSPCDRARGPRYSLRA